MLKRSGASRSAALVANNDSDKRRIDQLETIVEHCTAAKAIADAQGNRFLSYMLDMTIQATQSAKCTVR